MRDLRKVLLLGLILVLVTGAWLRAYPSARINHVGFDESYYRVYLKLLLAKGLIGYPDVVADYIAAQKQMSAAVIPPTRALFLGSAYLWVKTFGADPYDALRDVACLCAILTLVVTAIFIGRASSLGAALGVTALVACAPLEIQMAQRVYIDGFFAFWTLLCVWALWECLKAPERTGWIIFYAASLALLVTAKENAAFVFIALFGILALNRWAQIGTVTPRLLLASCVGPAIGIAVLALAAGGIHPLFETFSLNVQKSYNIPYVIETGQGPWFRYVLDMLIISPAVTLLAITAFFSFRSEDKLGLFFIMFIGFSYMVMASVILNLRYATIWDVPVRWLAFSQLSLISARWPRQWMLVLISSAVVLVCAIDLHRYYTFFVQHGLYDPVPEPMLRLLKILNS